jgi:hypothetical protein
MSNVLKEDILNLKDRLVYIELDLESQLQKLELRESQWKIMDEHVEDLRSKHHNMASLNIGSKLFATTIETLSSVKDSLFYEIVQSKRFKLNKEIFFDRNPEMFQHILEFLRNGKINYKRFNDEEKGKLLKEAQYYELKEMVEFIKRDLKPINFVSFEINNPYTINGDTVSSNKLEDIHDINNHGGICAATPAWIIIELDNEFELNKIEICGFTGNRSLWNPKTENNAKILTSCNKVDWTSVGEVTKNMHKLPITVNLLKSNAKYIKFQSTGRFGIGYLKIIKYKD